MFKKRTNANIFISCKRNDRSRFFSNKFRILCPPFYILFFFFFLPRAIGNLLTNVCNQRKLLCVQILLSTKHLKPRMKSFLLERNKALLSKSCLPLKGSMKGTHTIDLEVQYPKNFPSNKERRNNDRQRRIKLRGVSFSTF